MFSFFTKSKRRLITTVLAGLALIATGLLPVLGTDGASATAPVMSCGGAGNTVTPSFTISGSVKTGSVVTLDNLVFNSGAANGLPIAKTQITMTVTNGTANSAISGYPTKTRLSGTTTIAPANVSFTVGSGSTFSVAVTGLTTEFTGSTSWIGCSSSAADSPSPLNSVGAVVNGTFYTAAIQSSTPATNAPTTTRATTPATATTKATTKTTTKTTSKAVVTTKATTKTSLAASASGDSSGATSGADSGSLDDSLAGTASTISLGTDSGDTPETESPSDPTPQSTTSTTSAAETKADASKFQGTDAKSINEQNASHNDPVGGAIHFFVLLVILGIVVFASLQSSIVRQLIHRSHDE